MNRIEFVLVLLFTFFVIVIWVTSDVILVRPNLPDDPKIQTLIEPLNPAFDAQALELVANTRPDTTTPLATPRPSPTPIATPEPSASVRPTPTAIPTPTPSPTPFPLDSPLNPSASPATIQP